MAQELTEKEKKYIEKSYKTFFGKTLWLYIALIVIAAAGSIFMIAMLITMPPPNNTIEHLLIERGLDILFSLVLMLILLISTVWLHRKYLVIIKKLQD
ncbi:MAG: hypothetical protein HZA22_11200 [Nitrospirae bacterium]|nr:hypothetical protein [Nitrospirota bacterium]